MKKLIAIALAIVMVLTLGASAALAAGPQYANGKANLQPYGGQQISGSSGRAVINYDKEAGNWQFQLNVWRLNGNATYYVGILDKDGNFSILGSFATNPRGNGSFHAVVGNGVSRVGVAVAPTGADTAYALSTWDGTKDNITWNRSKR